MGDALNRLNPAQLRQAVTLLTRTEITLKQDYGQSVWAELEDCPFCSAINHWPMFY